MEGTGTSQATCQFAKKDQDEIMVRDKPKRQADAILHIATHVTFVKSSYIST